MTPGSHRIRGKSVERAAAPSVGWVSWYHWLRTESGVMTETFPRAFESRVFLRDLDEGCIFNVIISELQTARALHTTIGRIGSIALTLLTLRCWRLNLRRILHQQELFLLIQLIENLLSFVAIGWLERHVGWGSENNSRTIFVLRNKISC